MILRIERRYDILLDLAVCRWSGVKRERVWHGKLRFDRMKDGDRSRLVAWAGEILRTIVEFYLGVLFAS